MRSSLQFGVQAGETGRPAAGNHSQLRPSHDVAVVDDNGRWARGCNRLRAAVELRGGCFPRSVTPAPKFPVAETLWSDFPRTVFLAAHVDLQRLDRCSGGLGAAAAWPTSGRGPAGLTAR